MDPHGIVPYTAIIYTHYIHYYTLCSVLFCSVVSLYLYSFHSSLCRWRERDREVVSRFAMALIQSFPQLRSSPFNSPPPATFPNRFAVFRCSIASPVTVHVSSDEIVSKRNNIRLGLPSKGRMATDTLELLKVLNSH